MQKATHLYMLPYPHLIKHNWKSFKCCLIRLPILMQQIGTGLHLYIALLKGEMNL